MTIVKKEGEKVAGLRALKQPLYDTTDMDHNVATSRVQFFSRPQGQALPVSGTAKNAAHTNLKTEGQIGKPQQFELYGLQMDIDFASDGAGDAANIAANLKLIYETGLVQFYFGQQFPWVQIPAYQIPNGYHMLGDVITADDTNNTDYAFLKNGIGAVSYTHLRAHET